MTLVFVYGSLKRGHRHHDQLAGADLVRADASVPGHRLVLQGEYPAMCVGEGVVFGELYRVDDAVLARLDRFEGCPDLYRRVPVVLSSGERAFSYRIDAERARGLPPVAGGRW